MKLALTADSVAYIRRRFIEDIAQMERDGRLPPQPGASVLSNASRYWQRRELFHRRRGRAFVRCRITPWAMPRMVTVNFEGFDSAEVSP